MLLYDIHHPWGPLSAREAAPFYRPSIAFCPRIVLSYSFACPVPSFSVHRHVEHAHTIQARLNPHPCYDLCHITTSLAPQPAPSRSFLALGARMTATCAQAHEPRITFVHRALLLLTNPRRQAIKPPQLALLSASPSPCCHKLLTPPTSLHLPPRSLNDTMTGARGVDAAMA